MRSLRTKLVVYISLLVASLVGVAGFVEVRKRSKELHDELRENANNFAAISASTLLDRVSGLYHDPQQFTALQAAVGVVTSRHKALTRVRVVETLFGVVLFDSREFEEGFYGFKRDQRVFEHQALLRDIQLNQVVPQEREGSYDVLVPLFVGKQIADPRDVNRAVVFEFSTARIDAQLSQLRWRYFLQALAFVLIGILLATIESQAITRPLRSLTEGVRRISAGELDHRVSVASKDELGTLGENFNAMAGSLKESRDELVRAMEQVERQNVELRELDKLKDQFLANTSHELRTPINGILGLVSAVLDGADGPLNPKQANHLKMVKDSGERLKHLITNILDFSKLKAGKEELQIGDFHLSDFTNQLLALGEGLIGTKKVALSVELPAGLAAVKGDPDRTLQVLTNLLGNAVKFTEKGHIKVQARVAQGQMLISVEDTGPGIPEDAGRYLFQEFRQVDGSANRQYEGTGLGLAICKQLVKQMGGRIDFKSQLGKGSLFYFTLPLGDGSGRILKSQATDAAAVQLVKDLEQEKPQPSLAARKGASTAPRKDVDLSGLQGNGETIAVIDDDAANIESLRLLLDQNGYRVLPITDPRQAAGILEQQKVSLVLTDVRMPQLSGVEVCRTLRAHPATAKLPIFLVTAQARTQEDLHKATDAGADAYLLKPYDQVDLLTKIHSALKPKKNLARGNGQRILVVDDRPASAEGLALHLEGVGYKPIVSTQADKFLETCARERPDLAILDVRLGALNGFELCQQLRADGRFSQMPVMLVSGAGGAADTVRAKEVGAQEFVAKPFVMEDFLTRVAFHLKRASSVISKGNGERILVVDDMQVNVEALATQLEHRGFKALRALSGAQALAIAKAERPRLVVSDVMMPGMTGYDLCRELEADPSTGQPPVILLTAKSGTLEDKLIGFDAGAVDYVIKPFEPEELIARITRLLARGAAKAGGTTDTASSTGITRAIAPISFAGSPEGVDIRGSGERVLCVDDNAINLEVLKTHLEAVGYRTEMAKDGVEALEKLAKLDDVELILLDVMMPRMNGYEFLEKFRRANERNIPVVMVSAKDRPEESLQGFRLGVVDYVTKPFNPALLAAKVSAILSLRRAQSALATIRAELNTSRLVQQASFPHPVLDLPGYAVRGLIQCAESSGGDWYGYYTSPSQEKLTLIAGDVTGHGVSAALVALAASSVKTTVELVEAMLDTTNAQQVLAQLHGKLPPKLEAGLNQLLQVPHSPAALASLINSVFCHSQSYLRMTAFVLNLDLGTGTLRYANAGAPRPLMAVRMDGKVDVKTLTSPPSSVLGHDRQAKFVEGTAALNPGDALLIYSDGVTEAVNADKKPYGGRRLTTTLARLSANAAGAEALRDGVLKDLFAFTGDAPLEDDVTTVVLQRLA